MNARESFQFPEPYDEASSLEAITGNLIDFLDQFDPGTLEAPGKTMMRSIGGVMTAVDTKFIALMRAHLVKFQEGQIIVMNQYRFQKVENNGIGQPNQTKPKAKAGNGRQRSRRKGSSGTGGGGKGSPPET